MNIAVLGAGAWGTAIACATSARHSVVLHARDRARAREIASTRVNERYLPGVKLPASLVVSADIDAAIEHAARGLILLAAPTRALRESCRKLAAAAFSGPVAWLCKGLEEVDHRLAHEVVAEVWPQANGRSGPVSGPSFALEVARGLPTALTVAGSPGF